MCRPEPTSGVRLVGKVHAKAKKIVRQHDNLIIFVTPEAKKLGWSDRTVVKVSVVDGKIVIEKGMEL